MKKIGIVFDKERKPETEKPSLEIIQWLEEKGHSVFVNPEENILSNKLDFAIVIGGDGTVLRAANEMSKYEIPLGGINFGHRGFLCNIEKSEIYDKLEKILEGKFEVIQRTRIQAEVFNQEKTIRKIDALNEILIGGISRTVFLQTEVIGKNKSFKARITGDGAIFATKTGSTAYNINAGGPVLITDVFSIVANNAYFDSDFLLTNTKSFVTSTDAVFKIVILNTSEENLPFLVADGQRDYRLKEGDSVRVQKSANKTLFIKV
jgi:NAD+ kinase